MQPKITQREKRNAVIFVLVLFVLLGTMVVVGYTQYFKIIIPSLAGINNLPLYITIIFGFLAGMLSFFAPCSIAILPSYISYYLGLSEDKTHSRIGNSLKVGLFASLGMILFYVILGSVFILLAQINASANFIRILVPIMAIVLLFLGIKFVSGESFELRFLKKISSYIVPTKDRTNRNMFLFGIAYAGGSIACFLPIFILLIVFPFLAGNFILGFFAFTSFAIGKSLLMISTTVMIGFSKNTMMHKIFLSTDIIQKVGGVVIILVSVYLGYLSLVLFRIIPMLPLGGF